MKKCVPLVFGSKAMRNGLRSPHANVSWHFLPGAVRPLVLQRALSVPRNGFDGGMPPVDVMRRIFPSEDVLVPRRVVRPAAAGVAEVVAAAVADAHVEVAVVAEMEVAGVVVPRRRRDAVDEHELGGGVERVACHREPGDAVLARAGAVVRVVEVDEPVRGERRVGGDTEEALLLAVAHETADVDRGRRHERAGRVHAQLAGLGRDQHAAVRGEGERGRSGDRRHERVGEVRGRGGVRRARGGQGNRDDPDRGDRRTCA